MCKRENIEYGVRHLQASGERGKNWEREEVRRRGAFRKTICFCARALAASAFSPLECKLGQDKENPEALFPDIEWQILYLFSVTGIWKHSLIRCCCIEILFQTLSALTCRSQIPIHYKLSAYRLFLPLLITQSIFFFIVHIMYEMINKQRKDTCQWLLNCYLQWNAPKAWEPTAPNLNMRGMSAFVLDTKWRQRAETGSEPWALWRYWPPCRVSCVFAFSRMRVDLEGADR